MFMWLSLVADVFRDEAPAFEDDVWEIISRQPPSVAKLNRQDLEIILRHAKTFADPVVFIEPILNVLRWSVCTRRPLSVDELEIAFSKHGLIQARIQQYLGSFLRADINGTVNTIHETASAFIFDNASAVTNVGGKIMACEASVAHRNMAKTCLRALNLSEKRLQTSEQAYWRSLASTYNFVIQERDPPEAIVRELGERFSDKFPPCRDDGFLGYAASGWYHDFVRCEPDDALARLLQLRI
ncbi:hypothetical protein LTR78_008191 [Recurvomyces mirabilis]|uniref:Uncharacterized protein n=1 Tax=Recurvomyces mirabilis TaxID=574656 RepID=A0AAE0WH40_9PEZI|nr:hypothetical protein LTR78_008191 [Recurvomyces mirabilis]KAK5150610.1 hypothetical protein LTS14_009893 [Recurvomyces mirabilis]